MESASPHKAAQSNAADDEIVRLKIENGHLKNGLKVARRAIAAERQKSDAYLQVIQHLKIQRDAPLDHSMRRAGALARQVPR